MAHPFAVGQVIEVPGYPFIRTVYNGWDEDGEFQTEGWKPGCEKDIDGGLSVTLVADDAGAMILTVVSIHKPGKFPERIFYTRKWRDPDGKEFGATKLRIATVQKFRSLTKGYRHSFHNASAEEAA